MFRGTPARGALPSGADRTGPVGLSGLAHSSQKGIDEELSKQIQHTHTHTQSDSMPCVVKGALSDTPFISGASKAKHDRWGDSNRVHKHIPQQEKHQPSPCQLSFLCT